MFRAGAASILTSSFSLFPPPSVVRPFLRARGRKRRSNVVFSVPVCQIESVLVRNGGVVAGLPNTVYAFPSWTRRIPASSRLWRGDGRPSPKGVAKRRGRSRPAKGILFRQTFCFAPGFCPVVFFLQAFDAPRLLLGAPDKLDGLSAAFPDAKAYLAVRQMGGIFARISFLWRISSSILPFRANRSLRYSSLWVAIYSRVVRLDILFMLLILHRYTAFGKRSPPPPDMSF